MKVVLFCGGNGIRLHENSGKIPKAMVPVGNRPMIWHVMKYYAHFGHKDFILCLGFKGDAIKEYFIKYKEYISNDFILKSGSKIDLLERDIHDWRITFVDTGLYSNVAERLINVYEYLKEEEKFLVNYSDGLTDMNLHEMIGQFDRSEKVAMLMVSKTRMNFHTTSIRPASAGDSAGVTAINKLDNAWLNAGYYIFRKEIFDHLDTEGALLDHTFPKLVGLNQLVAYPYDGMFIKMDSFREKQTLDDMYDRGDTPWQVWKDKWIDNPQENNRHETRNHVSFSA